MGDLLYNQQFDVAASSPTSSTATRNLSRIAPLAAAASCWSADLDCKKDFNRGSVKQGFEMLEEMVRQGWKPNVYTHTTLINGLCKKGWTEKAFRLFLKLVRSENHKPNVATIMAYMSHIHLLSVTISFWEKRLMLSLLGVQELKVGWRVALATVIGFLGSAFGTVGGVGGGGIFVPMLTLIVGFDTKFVVALSKCNKALC